jgi:hypothetical protein
MPVPQQLARGDRMGRGPYEKSGMIEDTGLPPGKTVHERFDIPFPTGDVKEGGKTVRKTLAHELEVEVQLWYLPYGNMNSDPFLWHESIQKVSISEKGK